jgi:small subunit ribosomal protein S8
MTDPIADMLTRIRNAVQAKHARVDVPASTLKSEIARILQDEGYIAGFKTVASAGPAGGCTTTPPTSSRSWAASGSAS